MPFKSEAAMKMPFPLEDIRKVCLFPHPDIVFELCAPMSLWYAPCGWVLLALWMTDDFARLLTVESDTKMLDLNLFSSRSQLQPLQY